MTSDDFGSIEAQGGLYSFGKNISIWIDSLI